MIFMAVDINQPTTEKKKKTYRSPLPFEINQNQDVKSQIRNLLLNPAVSDEAKKNWLRDHFHAGYIEGTDITKKELTDLLNQARVKRIKSPTGVKRGKKSLQEGQKERKKEYGEGQKRGRKDYWWNLYRHGIDIPKGYVVHHIDGNRNNNNLDNLVLMTPKQHDEMHLIYGKDKTFRNYIESLPEEEKKKYYREFGGIPVEDMPLHDKDKLKRESEEIYNKLFESYERGNFDKPLSDKKGFTGKVVQPGLFDPNEFNMSAEKLKMNSAFKEFKKSKRKK